MCATQIYFYAVFCVCSVLCKPKLCDSHDDKCITHSAERVFVKVVKGIPGVEASDPLHLDFLEANLPTLEYKIIDGSLSGMKKCHMELLHFAPEQKKYYAHIKCPHLILESGYEINGYFGSELIEGKGTWKVDYYDFNLLINGDYEREIYDDKKMHIQLKNYHLETEATGKVNYDFKNLFNGDKVKSDALHEFANENWQFIDKLIGQSSIDGFIQKQFVNVNAFFKEVPVEDVFIY